MRGHRTAVSNHPVEEAITRLHGPANSVSAPIPAPAAAPIRNPPSHAESRPEKVVRQPSNSSGCRDGAKSDRGCYSSDQAVMGVARAGADTR